MSNGKRLDLADQILAAIASSGESVYRISKRSGISYPILHRFVHGSRGLSLESADKIAQALGLSLRKTSKVANPQKPILDKAPQVAAELLTRVYKGSLDQLFANALAVDIPSEAELDRLEELVAEARAAKKSRRKRK